MPEGLQNAIALGQERIKRVKDFQGQDTHPLFQWVMAQDKQPLNDFGRRVPLYLNEPGGETFFSYSSPDFRDPIAPVDDAMRVYPARSAVAIVLNGDYLRALKRGDENFFLKYQERIDRTANSLKKVLSRHFHGDATGTVAVSNSAIGGTGAATLNCKFTSGGTSAQAITKGAAWLKLNEVYDAINPATEAVRGTFAVTAEGHRSCSINVTSGTIAVSDLIVITGSYKKVPVGLRHLAGSSNRVLQNFDTTNATNLNTPVYSAGGAAVSPSMFSIAKGLVQTFLNDVGESKGKMIIFTPGHQKTLVNQAFAYRQYVNPKGDMTVYGVPSKYIDSDGDVHFADADAPDEQIRILAADAYGVGEDMPWGIYDDDGNQWRMRPGSNNAGSDRFYLAMGWQGQLEKKGVGLADALIDNVAHSGADYAMQSYV
jgi:hypothetical protein